MNKPKDHRVKNTVQGLKEDFAWHLRYTLAKYAGAATPRDRYTSFAYAVRDRIVERWMETQERYHKQNERRDDYLEYEKAYRGAVALVFFIFDLGILAVCYLFFFHAIPSHSVSGMPRLPK